MTLISAYLSTVILMLSVAMIAASCAVLIRSSGNTSKWIRNTAIALVVTLIASSAFFSINYLLKGF